MKKGRAVQCGASLRLNENSLSDPEEGSAADSYLTRQV